MPITDLKALDITIRFDKIFMDHVKQFCPDTCTVDELCRLAHKGIDAGAAHVVLEDALKENQDEVASGVTQKIPMPTVTDGPSCQCTFDELHSKAMQYLWGGGAEEPILTMEDRRKALYIARVFLMLTERVVTGVEDQRVIGIRSAAKG